MHSTVIVVIDDESQMINVTICTMLNTIPTKMRHLESLLYTNHLKTWYWISVCWFLNPFHDIGSNCVLEQIGSTDVIVFKLLHNFIRKCNSISVYIMFKEINGLELCCQVFPAISHSYALNNFIFVVTLHCNSKMQSICLWQNWYIVFW